jgi:structural maintenance of chromosome 1
MDAISFVLGIKSSHLRSSHLKDLVYRGRVMKTSVINEDGSAAAPVTNGHTNGYQNGDDDESHRSSRNDPKTAWVMAVYEDDAGDEQKWKRSITSQGSSEYRINNQVCTAQQYNDALERENILIRARNFLVFQGDVEAIAAQSSQDLTRLIEQISGSLEYKAEYEKLQAEEAQAAENQNFQLIRRRGINSEIKQYQEQKKEAENFQKKTEERDAAVVTQILWKLYHFQQIMERSSEKIQEHEENLKEFQRNVEAFEKKLDLARKDQAVIGREVGKIERRIKDKERSIDDKENSLVPIDEKVAQITREIEKFKKRIESVTKERDEQQNTINKAQKDLAVVEKSRQQFEDQWRESLKKQGKELSDADRKEYNTLRSQVLAKTSDNQVKLAALQRQLKSDEVTVNTMKGRVDSYQAAVSKLQAELDSVNNRKEVVQDSVQQIMDELAAKKKEYNQVKSERIRVNNTFTEMEERYREVLTRLDTAKAGMVQSDKDARMKEMIANLRRIYPGVRGRVGELCKPKQKKFEEAVITALGREFDSVIVETERIGIECVQHLKEKRHPPMTFIPLDNIKVSATNSAIKGINGARLTIDTIDFDTALERAMAYACGSSIVCDTFDIAKEVVYKRGIKVKAVSLEGHVVHKAGLITAGRMPENKGNKRRFEEGDVQNLERTALKLQGDIQKLPRPKHLEQQERTLDDELANLEQRLRIARAELQGFDKNVQSKRKELESAKKGLKEYEPKHREQSKAFETTQKSVASFGKAIAAVEDKIFAKFCQKHGFDDIRTYEAQQGSLEQEAAEKRSEFEVQASRLQNNLKWETSRYNATVTRLKDLQGQLKTLQKDVHTYEREKVDIEESLGTEKDELAALQDSLEEIRVEHGKKVDKVAEAKAEVQKKSKEIDNRQKEINGLQIEVQKNSSSKSALLRRCKLEQIQIPLLEGSLDDLPSEDNLVRQDPNAMDVDDADDDLMEAAMDDYGIVIDFDALDDEFKNVST